MDWKILVYARAIRTKFYNEDYTGTDDIFALVESGSFTYECAGERHTVSPLDGMMFRKGVRYLRKVTSPVCMHMFRLACDKPLFDRDHLIFNDKERIYSSLRMLDHLNSHVSDYDFPCKEALFADLINLYHFENSVGGEKKLGDPIISEAMKYLELHYTEKIDLTELARSINLSYVQFLRRFKKTAEIPPFEYIARLRLKKAQHLLLSTDLILSRIAPECGFENEYYFSAFFKKRMNLSPSAFRKGI